MKKISVCIPTWNRVEMLFESFENIIDDERVDEVCIVDDYSNDETWNAISSKYIKNKKVNLWRNGENVGCYRNKNVAVFLSKNEWCILFDSDNILSKEYLDKIYERQWHEDTIFAPDFAKPHFDYRHLGDLLITKNNVASLMDKQLLPTLLNTCNFFVNRDNYLKVWDGSIDPVTSDSEYFNYCWLSAGNKIKVVAGMEYFHRVHDGSHYKTNNHRTNGFDLIVKQKLLSLI